jgi:hypothetical protein
VVGGCRMREKGEGREEKEGKRKDRKRKSGWEGTGCE